MTPEEMQAAVEKMIRSQGAIARGIEVIMEAVKNPPPAAIPLSSPEARRRLEETFTKARQGHQRPSESRLMPVEAFVWDIALAFTEAEKRANEVKA